MKLKLVDLENGSWHIHVEENDVHMATLNYKGSGEWALFVARSDGETAIQHMFNAATVNEAAEHSLRVVSDSEAYAAIEAKMKEDSKPSEIDPSVKGKLFQGMIDNFYMSFSEDGVDGMNEFINLLAVTVGRTIAYTAKETDKCTDATIELIRDTVKSRIAFVAAMRQVEVVVASAISTMADAVPPAPTPPKH